jgi:hypothetical protein
MSAWADEFGQMRESLEKQAVRMREFAAQYEAAGRAIKAMDEFQAALLREQKQIAELQRLSEERQRKELSEWQAENEQRWKKELLRWDYQFQEQAKINQKLADRFPGAEKAVALLRREIEALWKLYELIGAQQLQEAQHVLTVVSKALEDRPKDRD